MDAKYRQLEDSVYQLMRAGFVFAVLSPERVREYIESAKDRGYNVEGLAQSMLEQMNGEIETDRVVAERAN